jgi:hypothetical protein
VTAAGCAVTEAAKLRLRGDRGAARRRHARCHGGSPDKTRFTPSLRRRVRPSLVPVVLRTSSARPISSRLARFWAVFGNVRISSPLRTSEVDAGGRHTSRLRRPRGSRAVSPLAGPVDLTVGVTFGRWPQIRCRRTLRSNAIHRRRPRELRMPHVLPAALGAAPVGGDVPGQPSRRVPVRGVSSRDREPR